jgi:hypothetical protein
MENFIVLVFYSTNNLTNVNKLCVLHYLFSGE